MSINYDCAVEIMGWEYFGDDDPECVFVDLRDAFTKEYIMIGDVWEPDGDRNQSRQVVLKAIELLSGKDGLETGVGRLMLTASELGFANILTFNLLSPKQECEVALKAVREYMK